MNQSTITTVMSIIYLVWIITASVWVVVFCQWLVAIYREENRSSTTVFIGVACLIVAIAMFAVMGMIFLR